jgi:DNA replication protein DnaC
MGNESNNDLSTEEKALLLKAARERRTLASNRREDTNQKQSVSKEEYVRRLENARKKDSGALVGVREEKINKASREWAKIVGETFSPAKPTFPQVLERIERIKTKQGLHKTSIVFQGIEYGRGKTWNAYSYLNGLVQLGCVLPGQIYFGTESSTMSRIASSGFERANEMRELKRDSHRIFFIDDVGQSYYFNRDQREAAWYELIDHIYTRNLTLVLTTNLTFTETGANSLGAWIGGRAFDRLRALVGNDGVLKMAGKNKRDDVFHENEARYHGKNPK